MKKAPIVFIAHNRPDYFIQCVNSLAGQCEDREVFCFIDGPRQPAQDHHLHYLRWYHDLPNIEKCRQICQEAIPKAQIFTEEKNLGIGLMLKKARGKVFETNEFIIIVEDDCVFQPYFVKQLDRLIDLFREDERVAVLGCNGERGSPFSYEEQKKNKNKLVIMGCMTSYVMRRSSYKKISNVMNGYWDLLKESPIYKERPDEKIRRYMQAYGASSGLPSSQDGCIQSALVSKGLVGVSTYTCNSTNIGTWGEHCTPEIFNKLGFARHQLYDKYQHDFFWNEDVFQEIKKELKRRFLK